MMFRKKVTDIILKRFNYSEPSGDPFENNDNLEWTYSVSTVENNSKLVIEWEIKLLFPEGKTTVFEFVAEFYIEVENLETIVRNENEIGELLLEILHQTYPFAGGMLYEKLGGTSIQNFVLPFIDFSDQQNASENSFIQAEYLLSEGKFEQAKIICDQILVDDEQNFTALFLSAKIESLQNKHEEAIEKFSKCIYYHPDNEASYIERASHYLHTGEEKKALLDINRILKNSPQQHEALFMRAIYYQQTGNLKKAISDFNAAIAIYPKNANYFIERGILFAYQNNIEEAEKDFKKAYELAPDNKTSAYHLGKICFIQGKFLDSLHYISASLKISERPEIYALRAEVYLKLEQSENAMNDITKAIELSESSNGEYFLRRGMLAINHLADAKKALNDFSKAYEIDSKLTEALYFKGLSLFSLGNINDAKICFEKVLEKQSEHLLASYFLAKTYRIENQIDKAIELLQSLLRQKSDFELAIIEIAACYAQQGKDRNFYRWFEKAVSIGVIPDDIPEIILEKYKGRKKFDTMLNKAKNKNEK